VEQEPTSGRCSIEVSSQELNSQLSEIILDFFRNAKLKLPKQMKKKVEEWKLSSGAVVMCLVAYSDGQEVNTFQLVRLFQLTAWLSPYLQY
jgi:hypothetical protein